MAKDLGATDNYYVEKDGEFHIHIREGRDGTSTWEFQVVLGTLKPDKHQWLFGGDSFKRAKKLASRALKNAKKRRQRSEDLQKSLAY